ncbi:sulfatase [Paenibacillus allorhizosphaerae]|uniref:Choline-sulfatase n=1 Tax=Paenibacillus allorhizosphaerae TaxID=2849866 RepID=A0ABM8VIA7_9BACL|nr:sulfatase-like hydrolase/transferase [Paenibacillus allorhizosphaerae]CAG7643907.1 Choline-sulfatase [Paenibacillus allorhizosphaerae]
MNIVVIICDQLRYDALQCNGNPYVQTPNLNRLAERSVQFTNAFTSAPICSPARHSLISGMYPFAHGVIDNEVKPVKPLETIAHKLNAVGYRSAHITAVPEKGNFDYGFESARPQSLNDILSEQDKSIVAWENSRPVLRLTAGPSTRTKEQHKGFLVAERAVQFIEEAADKGEKFHLWVGFPEPHPPFYPPKPFFEKFDQSKFKLPEEMPETAPAPHPFITKRQKEWSHLTSAETLQMFAGYYGLVEMVDQFVGMVLDTVERLNMADDTLIVFTSDHGEQLGEHGMYFKFVMREQSVHIPFMISHPKFAPGVRDELAAHVDLFPTLCDIVGLEIPEYMHGHSLKALLESEVAPDNWRKEVFAQMEDRFMIRTETWKLNLYDEKPGELYNISEDPKEFNNLIEHAEYTDVVHRLKKVLDEKRATVNE